MVLHQAVPEKDMRLREGVIFKQAGRGLASNGEVTWPWFDMPEMPLSSPSPNQRHTNYRKGKTELDCLSERLARFHPSFPQQVGKIGAVGEGPRRATTLNRVTDVREAVERRASGGGSGQLCPTSAWEGVAGVECVYYRC